MYWLARIPPASRAVYVAAWAEAGNTWREAADIDLGSLLVTGTLALAADTALGPVYFAYGAAEDGDDRIYLALGPTF